MNRTLDPMDFEQTQDYNLSQVVFEHVQKFYAVIRDRRRSASNYTSSYNGLIEVLGLTHDHFGVVAIAGSQSIRTQVNSYSSQFVLILVNSYSKFWSTRTHLVNSYSRLVNSYSFWSIRTQTQMSTN